MQKKNQLNLIAIINYFYKTLIVLLNILPNFYFDMTFCCNIIILDNLYLKSNIDLTMVNGFLAKYYFY